jgi:hypothetical protein
MEKKSFLKSKTLWLNLLSGILACTAVLDPQLFPPEFMQGLAIFNAVGNFVLRLYTTQPLG